MALNKNTNSKKRKVGKAIWLKNAMRSLGYTTKEVFTDITPSLSGSMSEINKTIKELGNKKSSGGDIKNAIKNNQWVNVGKRTIDRAIEDLKTGNFVNKKREEELQMKAMGFEDFFEDMNDLGNLDEDDNITFNYVDEGDSGQSAQIAYEVSESVRKGAEANLKASKANMEVMASIAHTGLVQIEKLGTQQIEHLSNMDNTLSAILQYHEENTTKFYEAAITVFEKYGTQDDDNSILNKNITGANLFENDKKFKADKYKEYIKQQAKSTFQGGTVGSTLSMLSPDMVEQMFANPIASLSKLAINKAIPGIVKESLFNLEKSFRDFVPTALARLGNAESTSNNTFKKIFGKIFGIKDRAETNFDIEDKITKDTATFDRVTRNAIVEVLPKYARESTAYLKYIAEHFKGNSKDITDSAEIYNYSNNKYVNKKDLRKSIATELRDSLASSYQNSEFGRAVLAGGSTLDEKNYDRYNKLTTQLFSYLTQNDKNLTAEDLNVNNEYSEINNILKDIGGKGNRKAKKVLTETLRAMYDNNIGVNNISSNQIRARSQYNQLVKRMSDEYDTYNLSSADIHGDTDIFSYIDENLNYKTRIKNQKRKEKEERKSYQDDLSDRIKSSARDLRSAKTISREGLSTLSYENYKGTHTPYFNENGQSSTLQNYESNGVLTAFANATNRVKNSMDIFMRGGSSDDIVRELGGIFSDSMKGLWNSFNNSFVKPFAKSIFGEKNQDGFREGGLIAGAQNKIKDTWHALNLRITGKSYKDSEGKLHTSESDDVKPAFATVKEKMHEIGDAIRVRLFGEDEEDLKDGKKKGVVSNLVNSLKTGLVSWKNALFGTNDTDIDKSVEEIKKKAMDAVPDIAVGATGGAVLGIASGGLLGTLIGGPVGGAILGAGLSFAKKSEKFQRYVFGEEVEDENGNKTRVGGLISQKVQNIFKDSGLKKSIIGGAAIGLAKNVILGSSGGFLGALVGGPLAGAVVGAGIGMLRKSDMFQTFLYGNEEKGKIGVINHLKNIWGKSNEEDGDGKKHGLGKALGAGLIGLAGGALTAKLIGQVGVLGASLTPAGPIGGALLGLGIGLKLSSKRFQKLLFGEKDEETGKRKGGLLGKVGNWMHVEVIAPMKTSFKDIGRFIKTEVEFSILEPLRVSVEPVGKWIKTGISNLFGSGKSKLGGLLEHAKSVLKPIGSIVADFLAPVRELGATITKAAARASMTIVTFPIKILGKVASIITNPFVKLAGVIHDNLIKPIKKFFVEKLKKALLFPFKLISKTLNFTAGLAHYGRVRFEDAKFGVGKNRKNKEYTDDGTFRSERKRLKSERKQQKRIDKKDTLEDKRLDRNRSIMAKYLGYDAKYFTEENRKKAEAIAKSQKKKIRWEGGKNRKYDVDPEVEHKKRLAKISNDSLINNDGKGEDEIDVRQLSETTKIRTIINNLANFFMGRDPLKDAGKKQEEKDKKEKEEEEEKREEESKQEKEYAYQRIAREMQEAGGLKNYFKNKINSKFGKDKETDTNDTGDMSTDDIIDTLQNDRRSRRTAYNKLKSVFGSKFTSGSLDADDPDVDAQLDDIVDDLLDSDTATVSDGLIKGKFGKLKNFFKQKGLSRAEGGSASEGDPLLVGDRGNNPNDAEIFVPRTSGRIISQGNNGMNVTISDVSNIVLKRFAELVKPDKDKSTSVSDVLSNVLNGNVLGAALSGVSFINERGGLNGITNTAKNILDNTVISPDKISEDELKELEVRYTKRDDGNFVISERDIHKVQEFLKENKRIGIKGTFNNIKNSFRSSGTAFAKGGHHPANRPILVGDGGKDPTAAEIIVPETSGTVLSQQGNGIKVYIDSISKAASDMLAGNIGKEVSDNIPKDNISAKISDFPNLEDKWDTFDSATKKAINRHLKKNGKSEIYTDDEKRIANEKRESALSELKNKGSYKAQVEKRQEIEKENKKMGVLSRIADSTKSSASHTKKHFLEWASIFGKAGKFTLLALALFPVIKKALEWLPNIGATISDSIKSLINDFINGGDDQENGKSTVQVAKERTEEIKDVINNPTSKEAWGNLLLNDEGDPNSLTATAVRTGGNLATKAIKKTSKIFKLGKKGFNFVQDKVTKGASKEKRLAKEAEKKFLKKNKFKAATAKIKNEFKGISKNTPEYWKNMYGTENDVWKKKMNKYLSKNEKLRSIKSKLPVKKGKTEFDKVKYITKKMGYGNIKDTYIKDMLASGQSADDVLQTLGANSDDVAKYSKKWDFRGKVKTKAKDKISKVTNKLKTFGRKAVTEGADDLGKSLGSKGIKEGQEGLLKKCLSKLSEGVNGIVEKVSGKFASKTGKKGAMASIKSLAEKSIKPMMSKVEKVVTKHFPKIAGKIGAILGLTGAAVSTGVGALGVLIKDFGFGIVSGLNEASNPRLLFHMSSSDETDWIMTIISAGFGFFKGTTIGMIFDIIFSLVASVTQVDLFEWLATLLYNIICTILGDNDKIENLKKSQDKFENEYDDYKNTQLKKEYNSFIKANNVDKKEYSFKKFKKDVKDNKRSAQYLSKMDYLTNENKTIGAKIADGAGGVVKNVGNFFKGLKTHDVQWVYDSLNEVAYKSIDKDTYQIYNVLELDTFGRPSKVDDTGNTILKTNIPEHLIKFNSYTKQEGGIKETAKNAFNTVKEKASGLGNSIKKKASGLFNTVKEKASGFGKGVVNLGKKIGGGISSVGSKIGDSASSVAHGTIDVAKNAFNKAKDTITESGAFKFLHGFTTKTKDTLIPYIKGENDDIDFNVPEDNPGKPIIDSLGSALKFTASPFRGIYTAFKLVSSGFKKLLHFATNFVPNAYKQTRLYATGETDEVNVGGDNPVGAVISKVLQYVVVPERLIRKSFSLVGNGIKAAYAFAKGFHKKVSKEVDNYVYWKSDDINVGGDNPVGAVISKVLEVINLPERLYRKTLPLVVAGVKKGFKSVFNFGKNLHEQRLKYVKGESNNIDLGDNPVCSVISTVLELVNTPEKLLRSAFGAVINTFKRNFKLITSVGKVVISGVKDYLIDKADDITFPDISDDNPLRPMFNVIGSVGKIVLSPIKLVTSLIGGIGDIVGNVKNKIEEKFSGISDAFSTVKKAFGGVVDFFTGGGEGGFGTNKLSKSTDNIKNYVKKTITSSLGGFGGKDTDNNHPYYSQKDSRWANNEYSSSNSKSNMGDAGCGPTAFAMVASKYKQKITPDEVADDAVKSGYRDETGTNSKFMSYEADKLGLKATRDIAPTGKEILSAVRSGKSMILNGISNGGANSPYTTSGHYVVAVGADNNGNILVNDPRGREYNTSFDPDELASQTRVGWKFQKGTNKKPNKRKSIKKTLSKIFGGFGKKKNRKGTNSKDWLSIVAAAKKSFGSQQPGYYTHNGGKNISITVDGKTINNVRTDCSGFVSACVELYTGNSAFHNASSSAYTSSFKALQDAGFGYIPFPGWDKLKPGDILCQPGSHVEIYAGKIKGVDSSYNAGSTTSCNNPGPTPSSKSHNYSHIYRPNNPGTGALSLSSDSTTSVNSTDTSGTSSSTSDVFGSISNIFSQYASKAMNGILTGNWDYNFEDTSTSSSDSSSSNSVDNNRTSSLATGTGSFPKYSLTDAQIKGLANIVGHEQGSKSGRYAEASIMANLTDIDADGKTTQDLINKATGGWFAHGRDRFNNPGNPDATSIQAVKDVIIGGRRTLPRYVNEHDCFSDLTSVKTNGKSIGNKSDRGSYVPFKTKVNNRYGAAWTFFGFPDGVSGSSDPFGYTSEDDRKKWGDDHYSLNDSEKGIDNNKSENKKQNKKKTTSTNKKKGGKGGFGGFGDNQNVDLKRTFADLEKEEDDIKTMVSGKGGNNLLRNEVANSDKNSNVKKVINKMTLSKNQNLDTSKIEDLLNTMCKLLENISDGTENVVSGIKNIGNNTIITNNTNNNNVNNSNKSTSTSSKITSNKSKNAILAEAIARG